MGWIIKVLFFVLGFCYSIENFAQEELPFWRQKPKLYKQILEERRVVVAVKKKSVGTNKKFRLLGVGAVETPLSHGVQEVLKFENLSKVSSVFKRVRHRPDRKTVYFLISAFGYQARLLMKYQLRKIDNKESQLDWKIVWGTFSGMVGHFKLREISHKSHEISLWGHFSGTELPLPDFFLRFTLEILAEKVAKKMRNHLEATFKANLKTQGDSENVRKKRR